VKMKLPTRIAYRRLSAAAALILLLGLGVLAAGCGGSAGPGVAKAPGSSSTTSASGGGSTKASAAAYAACMRKNGVPDFPDPDRQGRFNIETGRAANGDKIGPDLRSPQFRKAQQACRRLQPSGLTPTPQERAKAQQQMLKFAQCMRSHGVPKFPDPTFSPSGGAELKIGPNSGIDPATTQFQAAQKACQKFAPGSAMMSRSDSGQ